MSALRPTEVHNRLRKHMLVDGLDLVFDLDRSEGVTIQDCRDGRQYLDFFSFFATNPIGINHPKLRDKEFKEFLSEVALHKPSNSDVYTVPMAEFVDTFARIGIPDSLPRLFMVEGGSVAVENALKTAFDWKVRRNQEQGLSDEKGQQILHFREAFHGRTGYSLSLTNTTDVRKTMFFPTFEWPRIVNPKIRFPLSQHIDEVVALERKAVEQIEEAVTMNRNDIAALIIEPIQGEGGDNHFRPEFFTTLRELADRHEFLLIFDEVQTGIGLTGKMWGYQHFGIEPDVLSFGKKTQVCGILAGNRIDEVQDNVFRQSTRINSTWGGNLVDMVRFKKHLEIIEEECLIENARCIGDYLLESLEVLQRESRGFITNTRGRGLMCAFDLPTRAVRDDFLKTAFELGLIVLGCGERAIRFRPVLSVVREDVDRAINIVGRVLSKLS